MKEEENKDGKVIKTLRDIPVLLSIIGAFFLLSIKFYKVDVIERRVEKKIEIQKKIQNELNQMKLDYALKIQERGMKLEELEERIEKLEEDADN